MAGMIGTPTAGGQLGQLTASGRPAGVTTTAITLAE